MNLRAGATVTKELHPALLEANPGSAIVYISSIEGFVGDPRLPAYCASKAGLLGLTRSACALLGPDGIRVNSVCPGAVETPLLAPLLAVPGAKESLIDAHAAPASGPTRGHRIGRAVPPLRRGGLHHGNQHRGRWRHDRGRSVRCERRRRSVVARRGLLPDLSALLRRRERGRVRRSPRHHRPSRLPGRVGHRRVVALPGDGLARTATGGTTWPTTATSTPTSAHSRTSTPWSAEGEARGIRILLDLVPNHTSDQHPWFVDARRGRDAEHRDWYVWADPAPGRRPTQQLDQCVRRLGLGARQGQRPVLPPQLRVGATGPQLVERGRAGRLRCDRAVLVGPGGRRLPDRRLQHDDQGCRAAGQSTGH